MYPAVLRDSGDSRLGAPVPFYIMDWARLDLDENFGWTWMGGPMDLPRNRLQTSRTDRSTKRRRLRVMEASTASGLSVLCEKKLEEDPCGVWQSMTWVDDSSIEIGWILQ